MSNGALEPTVKQKRFILAIEDTLHIKFTGRSFSDATAFISENIDAFHEEKAKSPCDYPESDRQLSFISSIEKVVHVPYEGHTSREASDYITKYRPEFERIKQERAAERAERSKQRQRRYDNYKSRYTPQPKVSNYDIGGDSDDDEQYGNPDF